MSRLNKIPDRKTAQFITVAKDEDGVDAMQKHYTYVRYECDDLNHVHLIYFG